MPLRRFSSRLHRSIYYFYDDFVGSNYDNRWWTGRGTGGSLATFDNGILRVRANGGLQYELYQGDKPDFSLAANAVHTSRWRISSLTGVSSEIGLEAASPNHTTDWLCFLYNSAYGANWQAQCGAGGSTTTVDTGVVANLSYHEFRIECSSTAVKFFLDGVLVATITTNLTALLLQPHGYVVSTSNTEDLFFDWIEAYCDRAA
jgi:hypothetical protein